MNYRKLTRQILIVLALLLILDASLGILIGERYIYWGLEYTPVYYRNFILNLYETQPILLLELMLTELAAGLVIFFLARKLIGTNE
jgi:hypothetical protein